MNRIWVGGSADQLNLGGFAPTVGVSSFVAKFSIFETDANQITGGEDDFESEHYAYALWGDDDAADVANTQFVVKEFTNEGWNTISSIAWSTSDVDEDFEEIEVKFSVIDYYDFIHESTDANGFNDDSKDVGEFIAPRIYDVDYYIGYGVKYYQFDLWTMTSALDSSLTCTDIYFDYDLYEKNNVTYNETTEAPIYTIPPFMQFDSANLILMINTTDEESLGTYHMELRGFPKVQKAQISEFMVQV